MKSSRILTGSNRLGQRFCLYLLLRAKSWAQSACYGVEVDKKALG